ncbi:adenine phosphoribosyltransferase [Planctomycetota bacterium]
MDTQTVDLKSLIRAIPDWPKPGILFRDITPLLANHDGYLAAVEALVADYKDIEVDYVAAVEARGFIFGSAVAERLKAGFIPVRKKGKLPAKTTSYTYDLEYGTDTLEVHEDAVHSGAKVLLVDDLLATGGTMGAACHLIEQVGGDIVGLSFLIELSDLAGRAKLGSHKISTVITY